MRLTKDAVAALALPAGKTDHIEWDGELPGFGVRLRGERKSWIIQYRIHGRQRRESLGDVRKVTLDAARRIARQRFAQVELGTDPAAERAAQRAASLTLGTVAERYLDAKRERWRPSTRTATTRYFTTHWKPLRERPLTAITRADVAARLQELVKAHGRSAAGRARDNLSTLYAWAMREGLCEVNPVIATNDPNIGAMARDRVLSDDELRIVWNACGDDVAGRVVRMLLLTGARREEIGALKWREIEADVLAIPGERTKNGRELRLPLPAIAVELIAAMPQGGAFIFGRTGNAPFSGWSMAKARLDARIVMTNGQPLSAWRLHDLRRSMRSGLGRIGVLPHVAELAINHVKGGVEAIYDRHRYQREIGTALALWADHITALASGTPVKVIALRA